MITIPKLSCERTFFRRSSLTSKPCRRQRDASMVRGGESVAHFVARVGAATTQRIDRNAGQMPGREKSCMSSSGRTLLVLNSSRKGVCLNTPIHSMASLLIISRMILHSEQSISEDTPVVLRIATTSRFLTIGRTMESRFNGM